MKEKVFRQYRAVKTTTGWRDLSHRGKIAVHGPDRISFLHSMISNDVEKLEDGEGHYGTFLTATGKILADFSYYRFPHFLLIDVAAELLGRFREALGKYIIMDDVELRDISGDLGHYSVEGPKALDLLGTLLKAKAPSDLWNLTQVAWKGEALWWIRKDELASPGYEIILPSSIKLQFETELSRAGIPCGLTRIGPEAYEVLRLERGIPLQGVDFTERNNPVEAGLKNAYSLTKGCYIGQEVVAKSTHVGSAAKALSKLKLEGATVPERGALVLDQAVREIGRITSAAFSPMLECPIALGFLKRGFWEVGKVNLVEVGPEERCQAEVVEQFQQP